MKKQAINYSWPASLSDFSQDTQHENFTRGKLKVFYQGETADHRYFSETFAKELVKTLPYTPVVSYYDEEKEDFVGHATQQSIYGMVDPCSEPTFVEEDGVKWCVCDVVLYTERPDKVGTIAQKIVGHKQSLELDPKSAEYVINYDEKKHFKNIEFTAGKFVGVSVLGNDQEPAFTGSEFFAYNAEFENKMKILREYCESKEDRNDQGGTTMNYSEFIKLSWGDIAEKVIEAVAKTYQNDACVALVDMFDDSAIVRFYYYVEGVEKIMRVQYEISDNGDVKLGKVNEVEIVYQDIEVIPTETKEGSSEIDTEQHIEEQGDDSAGGEPEKQTITIDISVHADAEDNIAQLTEASSDDEEEKEEKEPEEEEKKEDEDEKVKCEELEETNETIDITSTEPDLATTVTVSSLEDTSAQVQNVETTPENTEVIEMKVSVDNENSVTQEDAGPTSFTQSEREEFETLKREQKIALIDSYKEDLSSDEYDNFISKVDTFESVDSLELELLKTYKNKQNKTQGMRAFAFAPQSNNAKSDNLDGFVRKNLR